MKALSKIIYFASIVFIVICVAIATLLKYLPIEFKNERHQQVFDVLFFLGIPVAILLTIARIGFKPGLARIDKRKIVLKTVMLFITICLLFMVYAFASFSDMCSLSAGEAIYISRTNKSVKIVKRYFGCGATDSTPATVHIYKETPVAFLFVYFTEVDLTKLDNKAWIKVKPD